MCPELFNIQDPCFWIPKMLGVNQPNDLRSKTQADRVGKRQAGESDVARVLGELNEVIYQ